ncbi:MAG: hypothetical protein LBV09_08205 [Deferribacteraceae bacterium]|jgi:hypothetical protein|nr:hypothetical protein [Deferribacteraceae bacterium]
MRETITLETDKALTDSNIDIDPDKKEQLIALFCDTLAGVDDVATIRAEIRKSIGIVAKINGVAWRLN